MAEPARRVTSHVDPMFTLAVIPTGILANPRCISDPEQLAKHICNAAAPVDRRLRIAGEKIKHVVVAGPACIATAIDEITTFPFAATSTTLGSLETDFTFHQLSATTR